MINNIHMQNFKCFTDVSLSLRPITILAGLNSSGKSTVLQAIRMWSKGDLLSGHGPEKELRSSLGGTYSIGVTCENGECSNILDFQNPVEEDTVSLKTLQIKQPVHFISASRLGPQTYLPLRVDRTDDHVGDNGEYVVEILRSYLIKSGVPEKLRAKNVKVAGLRDNIEGWLRELSPGVQFQYHYTVEADIGRTEFSNHRPTNVGFGLSYVLPIIVSVLSIASDEMKRMKSQGTFLPILLIENPESHLHPKGQTMMGRFLAYAASCGVQCIIETHSEHVFNGIRLAIKEGSLTADSAIGYFFEYNFSKEMSTAQPIFFDKHGMCDCWPNNFFDESEKTLLELISPCQ
ncbi:AAA family ATPase [Desulfovibrio litoralis]|uniref:Predicted ATPase n=1 Tax=Desulfovibrio litoralis DSM 11393 TaxID=1121455 RepID=A0A1M7TH43_9BACT|nr:DUF3696 domain-containing protein [Desulfovibrio litoralis]SHN70057.1 Predicted ATPase [Desulfovibrio litoralis DSM 11393]